MKYIHSIVVYLSVFVGISFSFWSLLSETRLVMLAFGLVAWMLLYKSRYWEGISKHVSSIVNHMCVRRRMVLSLLFVFALVLRIGLAVWVPTDVFDVSSLQSDWKIIFSYGVDLAGGVWPENKSWMTTLLYGSVIKCFGQSLFAIYTVNTIVCCLSGFFAYKTSKLLIGPVAGIFFAATIVVSPVFLFHSLKPATEHLYILFSILSVYCAARLHLASCLKSVAGWCLLSGLTIWCAIWTRGEGIVLFSLPLWVLVLKFLEKKWHYVFVLGGILSVSFFVCAALAILVNVSTNGSRTIFCSNDNLWPRLFGANVKTTGGWNIEDKMMIYNLYRTEHPECGWEELDGTIPPPRFAAKCPPEVEPYIREEISRRWKNMGLVGALKFMLKKSRVWRNDCSFVVVRPLPIITPYIMAAIPLLLLFMGLYFLRRVCVLSPKQLFSLSIVWVMAANCLVLCLSEVYPRYTFLFHALWGLLASNAFLNYHESECIKK